MIIKTFSNDYLQKLGKLFCVRERDPQYYSEKTSPTDYLPEMTKPLQHPVFDNLSKAGSDGHLPSTIRLKNIRNHTVTILYRAPPHAPWHFLVLFVVCPLQHTTLCAPTTYHTTIIYTELIMHCTALIWGYIPAVKQQLPCRDLIEINPE